MFLDKICFFFLTAVLHICFKYRSVFHKTVNSSHALLFRFVSSKNGNLQGQEKVTLCSAGNYPHLAICWRRVEMLFLGSRHRLRCWSPQPTACCVFVSLAASSEISQALLFPTCSRLLPPVHPLLPQVRARKFLLSCCHRPSANTGTRIILRFGAPKGI